MNLLRMFVHEIFHPDYVWNFVAIALGVVFMQYFAMCFTEEVCVFATLSAAIYFTRHIFFDRTNTSWKWQWRWNKHKLHDTGHWAMVLYLISIDVGTLALYHWFN